MKFALFFLLLFNLINAKEVPLIESISLSSNKDLLSEENDQISISIPCDQEKLKVRLDLFLGRPISEENLQAIKETISQFLASESDSLYLIQIPEQKIENGRIRIVALPVQLDKVSISGNEWFSSHSIQRAINLFPGDVVSEKDLLNQAAWVNRNPFIHTDIVLSPGTQQGYANLETVSTDRFPARFYTGADNTGSSFSGNERFFVGVNGCLKLSGIYTYQLTSGFDFPEFISHSGNLTLFLPWKNSMILYGGYATIHPDIQGFDSKGQDIQASLRYIVPFKPLYTPFQHQVLGGVDYKQTNSALFFLGALPDGSITRVPVNQKIAELFQFYLAYQLENAWDGMKMTFKFESHFSPFKVFSHQTESDYNSLRQGADIRYFYSRVAVGAIYQFPKKYAVAGLIRAQVSSGALLPAEQFGLGGADTVRGYQERVYLADNMILGNFEIRSPAISFFRNKNDELIFLGFIDTAYGYNWHWTTAYPKDTWLMGIGSGMRYQILPYLTSRIDYGFRIHNTPFGNGQIGRAHFSLTIAY